MLYAERRNRLNVGESGQKIGHAEYRYGMGNGGGALATFGSSAQAPVMNSRAFANTPYTSQPPFAVDGAGVPSPYGRMTYWGLLRPGEVPPAGIRTQQHTSSAVVTTNNSAGGGDGFSGLVSRPPTSSKLVSSDFSPLPAPGPGVYQNKPPLLFHSRPTAPFIVNPILPAGMTSMNEVMNASMRSAPSLGTTHSFGDSHRSSSAGGGGGAFQRAVSTVSTVTPRPSTVPNGQTFNIFYADGSNEKDQELRLKMEEHVRAVELQQANAAQMEQQLREKAERERREKEQEREEERRAQQEREVLRQRELAEIQLERKKMEGAIMSQGGVAMPPPKTPKKKKDREDVDDVQSDRSGSSAPVRTWLSQPEPILVKKSPAPAPVASIVARPAATVTTYHGPSIDLKPIALDLPPKTADPVQLTTARFFPPRPSRSPSPLPASRKPILSTTASPFDLGLSTTLQRISRDQERIVDLLERQTTMAPARMLRSPRGYSGGGAALEGGSEPLGSGRRPAPRGAGTFLTDGLRMPAGQTGLSSLLSAARPSPEAGGPAGNLPPVGASTLFNAPLPQHSTTTTKTFLSNPLKTPIFTANPVAGSSTSKIGSIDFPSKSVGPLAPLAPLSAMPSALSPAPASLQANSSLITSTKIIGPMSSTPTQPILNSSLGNKGGLNNTSAKFDSSVKLAGSMVNHTSNSLRSAVVPLADADDLSIEPSFFVMAAA